MNVDDGGLAIVRVKPMGAGGGGIERSGTDLKDGDGALKFDYESIDVQTKHSVKKFTYPRHVVGPELDNEGLYQQFLPSRIDAFFEGINVNVMCYGQTGTGKTHTIFGTPGIMERAGRGDYGISVTKDYGIFPRALLEIFSRSKSATPGQIVLTCSAIELSMLGNKCMFDTGRKKASQGLCSAEAYGVTIDKRAKPPKMYGMEEVVLETEEDVLRTFRAIATRNTAGTGMNDSSSRTHCFAFLKLYVKEGANDVRVTRFQFVDLAGSERLKDASGTTDFRDSDQAFTGMLTNYSLTMLLQAIRALVHQRGRERKKKTKPKPFSFRAYLFDLVLLLSESLEGEALTAVIVCVSQSPANASQSAFALDFGSEFAKLRLRGVPKKSVSMAAMVKVAEKARKEAAAKLKAGVSVKYTNIRKAQLLEAKQTLGVMGRLGAVGGAVTGGGSGAGGGSGGESKTSGGRRAQGNGGGRSTPRSPRVEATRKK